MKRYILIVAAVALAAVSCSKTYDVNPASPREIGFRNWTENLTKARTAGTGVFAAGDSIAVYGYKDSLDNSAPHTVFDDVVLRTTDGSEWTYDTPRFWDINYQKYVFYAVSPAVVGTEGTVDAQTGAITSDTISFPGDDYDVLVADSTTVLRGDTPATYFNTFGKVALVFNHVTSMVDFKVKKSSSLADATVTVSAFELSQIDTAGVLTVNAIYTDGHPVASWAPAASAKNTYGPADGVVPVDISSPIEIAEDDTFDPANSTAGTDPAASTFLIDSLIVMPQTFGARNEASSQQLSITYTIEVAGGGSNTYTSTLYLADFDFIDNGEQATEYVAGWEPGKHYTFFITIDAHKIDFSATITDWVAVKGYHYLTN